MTRRAELLKTARRLEAVRRFLRRLPRLTLSLPAEEHLEEAIDSLVRARFEVARSLGEEIFKSKREEVLK